MNLLRQYCTLGTIKASFYAFSPFDYFGHFIKGVQKLLKSSTKPIFSCISFATIVYTMYNFFHRLKKKKKLFLICCALKWSMCKLPVRVCLQGNIESTWKSSLNSTVQKINKVNFPNTQLDCGRVGALTQSTKLWILLLN